MSVLGARKRRKAEINIVPLIDVLVVLIFFFLVSMQFRNLTVLNLTLPQVETAGREQAPERLEISIDAEGNFYFNNNRVTVDQLIEQVRLHGRMNNKLPVLIVADENSFLRHITFVMDLCRQSGLETIRLQTR
jgi:biopolymer transport protein ExbD